MSLGGTAAGHLGSNSQKRGHEALTVCSLHIVPCCTPVCQSHACINNLPGLAVAAAQNINP